MKKLSWLAPALAVLLPHAAVPAQKITDYRLGNGLQLVVVEDHRTPAVSQTLWYRVGSSDDPPGKSGLAHYVEHMMFKGTERFGPGVFRRTVQDLGGSDNAFTSFDYTAYVQRISADHLEKIMELEADRMRGLRLSEEAIETERLVILEERSARTDTDPGALLREQINAALYLNHPYSAPVIGWRHEIERLSRGDMIEFYRRHYAPNNAILVIAGDVRPEEAFQLARRYYGPLSAYPGITPRSRPQEPPHIAPRRLVLTDKRISIPYIVRRYLAPERNPGEQRAAAALELLAGVLAGDGINSYLRRKLEIEEKIALHTDAFYTGTSVDRMSFGLVVLPADPSAMTEVETALDRALEEFLEEEVEEAQLNRVKKAMRASWIYAQDSVQNVARRIGQELTSGLTLEDIAAWPDIIQSITPQEIAAAAEALIRSESSVTGWAVGEEPES